MPIYEVASWTASDALLKDKAALKAGMDHSGVGRVSRAGRWLKGT